ncbi:MAG: DUF4007 family protein [Proteobacteria bacterium]|nr:DUF4007 family protein [Pseudomonadota bacterium]
MRFAGHETFAIREGWLHKGITLLDQEPTKFEDDYVADWLGVGRNMAKSIKHWLVATQLADRIVDPISRKKGPLEITRLGRTIIERDPYFLERGTWWALHANLANNKDHAATWHWFFNYFLNVRFERATCIESLRRYLAANQARVPSLKTLQRDIACLLTTYSKNVPPVLADPEDATDSPFRELGLLVHFRDSGSYGREPMTAADIPAELVPYALLTANHEFGQEQDFTEVDIREACLMPGGPGRCFNMELEAFYELCVDAESKLGRDCFAVVSLAGERIIRFKAMSREGWLESYYERLLNRKVA